MRELRSIQLSEPSPQPDDENDDNGAESPLSRQLELLAANIRQIYILCRRERSQSNYTPTEHWDGGVTRWSANRRPIWPSLAAWFLEHGYEPQSYIKAQFWALPADKPPSPNTLMSEAAVERYQCYVRDIVKDLRFRFNYEMSVIRVETLPLRHALRWDHPRALRWALSNTTTVQASALVRYCLANEYAWDDLCARFHDAALLQYVFQRHAIDEAWPAGVVPEPLKEEARVLAERLTAVRH